MSADREAEEPPARFAKRFAGFFSHGFLQSSEGDQRRVFGGRVQQALRNCGAAKAASTTRVAAAKYFSMSKGGVDRTSPLLSKP